MNVYNIADAERMIQSTPNQKVVFITGVTGQDGSLLADYLLDTTDYLIFGGARRLSVYNHTNIEHLNNNPRFKLLNFDLTDPHSISKIVEITKPDYFVNLAAQSFVGSSWDFPTQTWECNTTSIIHTLEAIRKYKPTCRYYNGGSSEEFGNVQYVPQDEKHPLKPRSPYGASKAAARLLIKVYRESYNLFAIQGLLFNHESHRRGEEFVTRKITKGIARIKKSLLEGKEFLPVELGNIDVKRDWSNAEDFVIGIWKMLNQDAPNEYILSSNETHTVREFVELAFKYANIDGAWHGKGINEEFSISTKCVQTYNVKSSVLVKINPNFFRPAEVDILMGDSTLARKNLNWTPKTTFDQLVAKMVNNDLKMENIN